MRLRLGVLLLIVLCPPLAAQQFDPDVLPEESPVFADRDADTRPGPLASNRNFPNFIGFMSNPLQNIDPRSLTQIWPMFGSVWTSASPPLPDTNFQVLGPGMNIALSERLSAGLNQGGYAFAHINRQSPTQLLDALQRARLLSEDERLRILGNLRRQGRLANLGQVGLLPDLERAGALRDERRARILRNLDRARLLRDRTDDPDGWLNLGGFIQYTLIQDVEEQFLFTAGLRWEAPSGSKAVFQGRGPAYLAPYVTAGKELGNYHVLATVGYEFPAATANTLSRYFYANVHLDRQCFGWVYPLIEFNWTQKTTTVDVDLQTQRGFIDLGNFSSTGNLVTMAVGANLVLIRDRLELGGVYTKPLATQKDFDFNGMLVKMVLRY